MDDFINTITCLYNCIGLCTHIKNVVINSLSPKISKAKQNT